ncbi:hypothetical protein VHEMI08080 [[Torrubiella] hemipterigena]|uniref:Extracellular membrane protein CFEM domain-containing protein n=1 Tax=[Torrubiella] hemipterigena TaxID=1531966 RepID=A0A0A1T5I1_9HYPO|nr:hypothetical protein VHEMI08080 [[Torrubiella] hemipterigena]
MKYSLVALSLVAAATAADTSLSQILSGMKVCGWACLPSAASENECAITNLDCLCQTGEGGILAGTRVSSLTSCEKAIKFCGVEGDKHFDLGDALDSACERFRSGKPSAEELQSMTDYINAHYASATAVIGSASATGGGSAAATTTVSGKPAKSTGAGSAAATTAATAAPSGNAGASTTGGASGQSSTHKAAAGPTAAPMMALAGAGAVLAAML